MSSTRAIRFGVPQRSILGPLLFVLYIYDLPQCLENCSINMYADDIVQDDLNRVVQWKVAGLSLIRVKQNQCSLEVGRILPNHQIFVYRYTERLQLFRCCFR